MIGFLVVPLGQYLQTPHCPYPPPSNSDHQTENPSAGAWHYDPKELSCHHFESVAVTPKDFVI
jgi:hypothetical protein